MWVNFIPDTQGMMCDKRIQRSEWRPWWQSAKHFIWSQLWILQNFTALEASARKEMNQENTHLRMLPQSVEMQIKIFVKQYVFTYMWVKIQ